MITEDSVVSKIEELMEALDIVKRYNAFASSLKKFALFIVSSMTVFVILAGVFEFLDLRLVLDKPVFFVITILLFLIPVTGVLAGVLFVKRRVNAVPVGAWREELSQGFPSALEMLLELDWEKTFDEISMGKISYALYAILKTAGYWLVTFFALNFLANTIIFLVLQRPEFFGALAQSGALALLIVFLILGNDLLRRYKELLALDMLLMELRWFSFEFRRAGFET
jgi:hypothetical protein